jgi:hypothetical protein
MAETVRFSFLQSSRQRPVDQQPENGALPESDIGFCKVAKILHFLATFLVHPWTVLTFHESVPQMIEWL